MMFNRGKTKEEGNHKKRKNQQVTSSNMVLKSLLRPGRYFDGIIMTNRCFNPNKPRRRPCLICASLQHVTKHCSVNRHQGDEDCSDNKTSVCLRCGGLGHDMGLCKYEYGEDDLKSVQCYVCKRFGHLCCVEPCDSLWAVSCYRCGELGHTGLSCGRHFEGSPEIESGFGRVKEDEKKKRRLEKALADLEKKKKKKKQRLDEEGVAIAIQFCTQESNGIKKKKKRKKKKNNKNSEHHVTAAHESNREKNDGNLEQHSTLHESSRKNKKRNVESGPTFTAHESNRKRKENKKAKDEQPPVVEKPDLRSGLITEDFEENPFHRRNIRRLSSPSGHGNHILPVSPPGHHYRLPTAHMDHDYGSPRFISGGHYPGSHSTTPYDRNRTNSSFEYYGHLSGPPSSRLWQHNYPPTSPIAPLGHSQRSPTFISGGPYTGSLSTVPCGGNRRYSSFESNMHPLDPPFSRLRQSYYSPTSPIAPSLGHDHICYPLHHRDITTGYQHSVLVSITQVLCRPYHHMVETIEIHPSSIMGVTWILHFQGGSLIINLPLPLHQQVIVTICYLVHTWIVTICYPLHIRTITRDHQHSIPVCVTRVLCQAHNMVDTIEIHHSSLTSISLVLQLQGGILIILLHLHIIITSRTYMVMHPQGMVRPTTMANFQATMNGGSIS